MISVTTYKGQEADFYIQSKGLHSGRPMKTPKANCFAVVSDVANLFEIVFALYKSNAFKSDIIGSVVPFIRIYACREILKQAVLKQPNQKELETVELIEKQITNLEAQIKNFKQIQRALALKSIS